MKFGSICSGIEAASAAWLPLGWCCSFMSEIDAFPRTVLNHHYPDTKLHGDFTTIQSGDHDAIDVMVGGTPCQSFSVAGLRGGMADERGNLALEYLRLAERLRPRWLVWENVPGVLSSAGGRDFGSFVGGLGELGYGWAYRVLDAQYFGLAQRRKRVFVVGYLGDWRRAAAVLFEPASLRGDIAPSRATRERVAASLTRGADSSGKGGYAGRRREDDENLVAPTIPSRRSACGGLGTDFNCDGGLIANTLSAARGAACAHAADLETYIPVSMALNAHGGSGRMDGESETFVTGTVGAQNLHHTSGLNSEADMLVAHSLRADGFDASEDGTGSGTPLVQSFNWQSGGDCRGLEPQDMTMALSRQQTPAITGTAVRRLTPRECERLQGFSDDFTLIPYRGKPAADAPRYRALGNSMAVPVMRWIGRRIEMNTPRSPAPGRGNEDER